MSVESMAWPLATFGMFADPEKIVRAAGLPARYGGKSEVDLKPRVLVIAGGKDVLMKPGVMAKLVGLLRAAVRLGLVSAGSEGDAQEGVKDAVEFRVVQGSGHQLMNDIHWKECAENLLKFLQ